MTKLDKIIKKHQDGTVFDIFVTPGARKIIFPAGCNEWRKSIEISVSASAEKDKANKEIIQTIADFFNKPLSDIYILSGRKNREKTVLVKGANVSFISERLREIHLKIPSTLSLIHI